MRPLLYEITATLFSFGRRRAVYDRLAELSGARPGEQALDVGCGTGYLTRRLAAAVSPGGSATGIDPSPPMLEYAARKAPGCRFDEATAEDLPYDDASFDLATASLSIHHVPADHQLEAFRELRRVLRPDGRLLIMELRGSSHGHVVDDLPGQIESAGFSITGKGRMWPRLQYVQAQPD